MTHAELRLLSPRDFHAVHMDIRQRYEAVLQVAGDIKYNPMALKIKCFFDSHYPEYKQPISKEVNVLPRKVAIYLLSKHTNLQDKDKILFLSIPTSQGKCYNYRQSVNNAIFTEDKKVLNIIKEFEVYLQG